MSDLLKQLEQEHQIKIGQDQIEELDDEYEESQQESNNMNSELENFDKKIKVHKEAKRVYNGDSDQQEDSDSDQDRPHQKKQLFGGGGGAVLGGGGYNDDEDDNDYAEILRQAKQQQQQRQQRVSFGDAKPPAYKPPNIEKIQQNIMTQQKVKVQQSEDYQVADLLNNGSESQKDKKIRELLTRNRNLQVQYEREKALKVKMENQLNQMIKDNEETLRFREQQMGITSNTQPPQRLKTGSRNTMGNSQVPSEASFDGHSQADTDWQKKFQQTDKKLQEFRVTNQNLKNELNKAHRVITREIGENFNVDKVLSEENSWKGRAQTIEKLKAKVRDLSQKLGMATNTSGFSDMTLGGMSTMGGGLTSKLDKSAAERRKEIENLKEQNQKLKEESDLITSKFKAMQSRKQTLEVEVKEIKSDYEKNKKILMQKSNADDQYINALKSEYDKLKKSKTEARVIYKNSCEHEHKPASQIEQDQIKMKEELKLLTSELDTKEAMIQELIEEKLQQDEKLLQFKKGNSGSSQLPNKQQQQVSMGGGDNDVLLKKLQQEVKILKLERQEFFQDKVSDKESRQIIKDLSMQNAKYRAKVDDLQQQIKELR